MTSEIRTNSLTSRAGLSTVTLTDSGPMFSGITTFVDNSTFSVGTGGTIHAPATNVMALGTNSIDAIKIDSSGNVNISGILTASSINGGVSLAAGANNRVVTATGAAALTGESTLTYDGNKLKFGGGSRALTNGYYDDIVIDNSDSTSGEAGGSGISIISGNASWGGLIFGDNDEHQKGYIKYAHEFDYMQFVAANGQVRIESGGSVGINSCIHHLSDTDTNFGFPSNDSFILRIAGSSRLYTNNSEPIWNRRDVSAGVSTQTMLLNYNNAAGSGVALAFAPSTNYDSRHSSIEVVNEGNNNMTMRFKVTDANQNAHAIERMRIQTDGDVTFSDSATGAASIKNVSGNQSDVNNGGFPQYAFVGNEGTGMRRVSSNVLAFDSSGSERIRIDSLGNVSFGGIAPVPTSTSYYSACLHIHQQSNNSTSGAQVHLTTANKGSGSAAGAQLSQYNGSLYINNQDDQFMYFYNNDNTGHRMAIRNDGTVCFGNQTSNTLYSSGGGSTWYDQKDSWQMAQSGTIGWSCWYINKIGGTNVDNRMIQFNSSGSAIGYISRSGSNIVYQTSSDYRLKKDVVALPNSIDRVKQLRPVAFKWIEDNSDMEGFLAHEAQEVVPYAVSGKKDEVATEDFGDRKKGDMIVQAIDYGEFTPLLTAAMKELISKVETLEQENIALRVRVTNLEGE